MDKLLFVSSQPDVPYFHWQVRIYIHNFIERGINPNNIHVLFGMANGNTKPTEESLSIKELGVNVHHYLDNREFKNYIPSIKPFLVYQWLKEFPQYGECFFLHDSDIVFRELPDFSSMINDKICYLSDTIGYIGYNYIMDCCNRYESKHPTSEKGQLLQDPFLNILRKEHVPVSIYLVNGIKLQGQIESFDQYVVLLRNTVTQMVYKHAISTIVPGRPVNFAQADAPDSQA